MYLIKINPKFELTFILDVKRNFAIQGHKFVLKEIVWKNVNKIQIAVQV